MGFIYIITCLINNKIYIGQTTDTIQSRWNSHKSASKYNKKYLDGEIDAPHAKKGMCSALYRSINCHGIENFKIEALEELDDDLLNEAEVQFIEEFNSLVPNGYNLTTGGDNFKHSEETKNLLKILNKEHMKTTFKQFRKYDALEDLPMYCIYLKDEGVAINKHPLCNRKNFTIKKYGSLNNAKDELRRFLDVLENNNIRYRGQKPKREIDLPAGVRKIKKGYFVDKTINKVTYRKAFSSDPNDENNKINAINYLNTLIN